MRTFILLFIASISLSMQAQINQTKICKIAVDLELKRYKVYIDNANTDASVDSIAIYRYINNTPTFLGKVHKDTTVFIDYSFNLDSMQMNNQTIKYTLKETYSNSASNDLANFAFSHSSLAFRLNQDSVIITREYEVNNSPITVANNYGFKDKYYLAASYKSSPFGQVDTILGPHWGLVIGTYGASINIYYDTTYYGYVYVYPYKVCSGLANKSNNIDVMSFVNVADYINNPKTDDSSPALSSPENLLNKLEVFPNPTSDVLNVSFHSKTDASMVYGVYDLQGRNILQNKTQVMNGQNAFQVNVSGMQSGVYFISLESNNERIINKFIVR